VDIRAKKGEYHDIVAAIKNLHQVVFTEGAFWEYADNEGTTAPYWYRIAGNSASNIDAWFQLRLRPHKVIVMVKDDTGNFVAKRLSTSSSTFISGMRTYIPASPELGRPRFFMDEPNVEIPRGITVSNGFLHFRPDGVPELLPHSHTHRSRHFLDTVYDAGTDCPYTRMLIDSYFTKDKDNDGPGKKRAILQFLALCLFGQAAADGRGKILYITGEKGTGKSTLIENLVGACFDSATRSAVEPHDFGNPNARVMMVGKLLNFRDELNSKAIRDVGTMKAIVSGSEISVRSLYENLATARITCGHLFVANERAITGDSSGALQDRTWYVHFTHPYDRENEPTSYIRAKVMTERAGILNLLCSVYREMLEKGGGVPVMDVPKSSKLVQQEATLEADSLRDFVQAMCTYDPEAPYVTEAAILQVFNAWKPLSGVSDKFSVSAKVLGVKVAQIFPQSRAVMEDGQNLYRIRIREATWILDARK
jgi:phage/plasmid-associated DNA primase